MFAVKTKRLLGDMRDTIEFSLDGREVIDSCRVGNHRTKKVHQVHHGFERVVDFMGDRRRHAAGYGNLFCLQQGLFKPFARGDIAQNLGRADNPTVPVSSRRNSEGNIEQLTGFESISTVSKCSIFVRADIFRDGLLIGVKDPPE